MRWVRIARATSIAMVMLQVASCIPVPIPTKATQPRYSEAQLESLVAGSTTREAVQQAMGVPDVRRAGDRLWVYNWSVDRGKLLVISPVFVGEARPMASDRFRLFLEFNASGVLQSYSFAQRAEGSEDERYCTAAGFCLEHPVNTGEATSDGIPIIDFIDAWSAVTANGAAKASLGWPVPPAGGCVFVLWPDASWSKSSWVWGTPLGLPVIVDRVTETEVPTWLPNGSFAVMLLPAGEHTLRTFSPWLRPYSLPHTFETETSTGTFECRPGEQVYLAIGASTNKGNRFPIVLTRVDEAVALPQIATMPRVVLPQQRMTQDSADESARP